MHYIIPFLYQKPNLFHFFGLVVNITTGYLLFLQYQWSINNIYFESQSSYTAFGCIHFCLDIEVFSSFYFCEIIFTTHNFRSFTKYVLIFYHSYFWNLHYLFWIFKHFYLYFLNFVTHTYFCTFWTLSKATLLYALNSNAKAYIYRWYFSKAKMTAYYVCVLVCWM